MSSETDFFQEEEKKLELTQPTEDFDEMDEINLRRMTIGNVADREGITPQEVHQAAREWGHNEESEFTEPEIKNENEEEQPSLLELKGIISDEDAEEIKAAVDRSREAGKNSTEDISKYPDIE